MKAAWTVCAILFLATALVAQNSTPPKPKKAKSEAAVLTAADVQSLRDAIAAQQPQPWLSSSNKVSGTARRTAPQGPGSAAGHKPRPPMLPPRQMRLSPRPPSNSRQSQS